ncbi:VanZ family protein [Nonomuraea sp. NPDC050310]|uniref:VanZ family protein n=1 Tax=unclassified Nonomuraea TaxID=2593643 RepID=UPI0033FA1947
MSETFHRWGNIVTAGALAVPLAVLAMIVIARVRRGRGHPAPARTAIADVGIVAGTVPWVWMILTPAAGPSGLSLIPFHDLAQLATAPWQTVFVQVGGNLLVLAALGALLPVRSPRFASLARVALVAALGSALLETLQYGLRLGRLSSIDDVVINTAGAVLAALVTRRWWARPIAAGIVPR